MVPIAFIEHQLPGRVRLSVPERRGDEAYFQKIVRDLSTLAAVRSLKADARRGSLVIHHDEDLLLLPSAPLGLATAQHFELCDTRAPRPEREPLWRPEEPMNPLASLLTLLGLLQLGRGSALGPSSESFWNALRASQRLGSRGLAADYAILGLIALVRLRMLGSATSLFFNAIVAQKASIGVSTSIPPTIAK